MVGVIPTVIYGYYPNQKTAGFREIQATGHRDQRENMDTITQVDLIPLLLFAVAGIFSALIALLSWLANKMYEKLQTIEALFMKNLSEVSDRFHVVETRLTRAEVHIDLLRAPANIDR